MADWMTVAEAARTLGVSSRTVRRWAAQGTLQADRTRRPYVVLVSDERLATTGQVADMTADLQAEIGRLQQRVQELEADKLFLQNALAAAMTTQHRLLEAPKRWRWPWQR